MSRKEKTELLAPAGSYEAFQAAIKAGADAVYLGGSRFGARAYADNFTEELLLKALDEAHLFGKKIFLTVNTLFKERELEELYSYILPYYRQGLDAVIVQDMGALKLIKESFPGMAIHASTQMTVTGYEGAAFLEKYGVSRVVPARELSLEEIRMIRENTSLEIECFVHGALCYCYSGQCLMSSFLGGRSGNRGRCAQPCRLPYKLLEDGKILSAKESSYALNTKDICLIDDVAELIRAGVTSFKIEGRMKRPEYTAGVVSVYRKYIDLFEKQKKEGKASRQDREFLESLFNRDGFSRSYFFQHNGKNMMALKNSKLSEPRMKKAEAAYKEVQDKILSRELKKELQGRFCISGDLQAELEISDGENTVTVRSGEVAESVNRPLDIQTVEKQMKKTGGSEFSFANLEIQLPDNAFMTMKQLNELRREGFRLLREESLKKSKRNEQPQESLVLPQKSVECEDAQLWVSVQNKEQFDSLSDIKEIAGFYIPYKCLAEEFDLEKAEKSEKEIFISLPYISRQQKKGYKEELRRLMERNFGFLVRNLEDLSFLTEVGAAEKIRLDYNMYTMNQNAMEFWKEQGIREYTVPLELNKKEIRRRDNADSDMILYGNIPLMISAQCLRKNYQSCTKGFGSMMLKDRKEIQFPVYFDCEQCYNIIYNSLPLSLLSEMEQVKSLGAARYRLIFTWEKGKKCRQIVRDAIETVIKGNYQYKEAFACTRGHFNRGVE